MSSRPSPRRVRPRSAIRPDSMSCVFSGWVSSANSGRRFCRFHHPLRAATDLANQPQHAVSSVCQWTCRRGTSRCLPRTAVQGDIAYGFLAAIFVDPQVKPPPSSEHFSADGTLIEARASIKSFRPNDGSDEPPEPGRNGGHDFRGEKAQQRYAYLDIRAKRQAL